MSKRGEKAIQERRSDPIPNAFNGGLVEYYGPMRVAFQKVHDFVQPYHDGASVAWLTEKLGKRSYVWANSRRYHVWERDTYRVFAAPEYGMSVEYFPSKIKSPATDTMKAEAQRAMDDFIRDVGLTEEVRGPDSEVHAMPSTVAKELALTLRAAIRAHRDSKQAAGTEGPEDKVLWDALFVKGPFGSWIREGFLDPGDPGA